MSCRFIKSIIIRVNEPESYGKWLGEFCGNPAFMCSSEKPSGAHPLECQRSPKALLGDYQPPSSPIEALLRPDSSWIRWHVGWDPSDFDDTNNPWNLAKMVEFGNIYNENHLKKNSQQHSLPGQITTCAIMANRLINQPPQPTPLRNKVRGSSLCLHRCVKPFLETQGQVHKNNGTGDADQVLEDSSCLGHSGCSQINLGDNILKVKNI